MVSSEFLFICLVCYMFGEFFVDCVSFGWLFGGSTMVSVFVEKFVVVFWLF